MRRTSCRSCRWVKGRAALAGDALELSRGLGWGMCEGGGGWRWTVGLRQAGGGSMVRTRAPPHAL